MSSLRTVPVTCDAATTANVATFSAPPSVVDGVTLTNGDVVLVKEQDNKVQNGFYQVNDGGSWSKSAAHIISGMIVVVMGGDLYEGQPFITSIDGLDVSFYNVVDQTVAAVGSAVYVAVDSNQTITGDKDFTGALTKSGSAVAVDNTVVHLSGTETITGTKNFTGTLQSGGNTVATTNTTVNMSGNQNISGTKNFYGPLQYNGSAVAIDSAVMHNSGTETISGTKNFTGSLKYGGVTVATSDLTDMLSNFHKTSAHGNWQISATSYSDCTDTQATYSKLGDNTESDLLVIASIGCRRSWTAGGANVATFCVNVDGVQVEFAKTVLSTTGHHVFVSGQARFTTIGSGSYVIKLQAKSDRTDSDVWSDSNDTCGYTVFEIPK